jgi:hypothetical protein
MHHADSNTLLVRKKKKTRLERTCSAKESNPPKHWTRTEEQQENNTEEKYIAELSYSRCIEELKMIVIECFKRNRGRDGGGARVGSEEQGTDSIREIMASTSRSMNGSTPLNLRLSLMRKQMS